MSITRFIWSSREQLAYDLMVWVAADGGLEYLIAACIRNPHIRERVRWVGFDLIDDAFDECAEENGPGCWLSSKETDGVMWLLRLDDDLNVLGSEQATSIRRIIESDDEAMQHWLAWDREGPPEYDAEAGRPRIRL